MDCPLTVQLHTSDAVGFEAFLSDTEQGVSYECLFGWQLNL